MTIEHTDSTNAVENPWAAFAPTVLEIPEDRWEEFFKTAPADTLISIGGLHKQLYLKGSGLSWTDLQDIEQASDEGESAGLQTVYPSTLMSFTRSVLWPITVQVLRLGANS